jgi:hypothetical protein
VTFGNEEEHLQEKQLIQLLMVLLLKGLGKKETQVQLVEIVTIENPVVEKVVGIEIIETVTEDLGHQGPMTIMWKTQILNPIRQTQECFTKQQNNH